MTKQITAYEDIRGNIHKTKEEAEKADAEFKIHDSLLENPLIGNYAGSKVEPEDLIEWIQDNSDLVLSLVEGKTND